MARLAGEIGDGWARLHGRDPQCSPEAPLRDRNPNRAADLPRPVTKRSHLPHPDLGEFLDHARSAGEFDPPKECESQRAGRAARIHARAFAGLSLANLLAQKNRGSHHGGDERISSAN